MVPDPAYADDFPFAGESSTQYQSAFAWRMQSVQ